MKLEEKQLSTQIIYNGKIIRLELDTALLPDGSEALREVVRHPGGVGVAAVDEAGYMYFVRQYRYPFGRITLEIPAGKLDKGEDIQKAGERELMEETGLRAANMEKLGSFYATPGFCDEEYHIYLATGLAQGEASPDEDEFVECEKIHIKEAYKMAIEGKIKDGKTVLAILTAREKLGA